MELPPSQISSSQNAAEPVSADVLIDLESSRRTDAVSRGLLGSGCSEIDAHVLMGGLERGSLVGVSAAEEEFGLKLALQVLGRSVCGGLVKKPMVITPKPVAWIAGALRDAVKGEVVAGTEEVKDEAAVREEVRRVLDRVMLSCVFDLDGLWEVLAELDEVDDVRDEAGVNTSGDVDTAAGGGMLKEVQGDAAGVGEAEVGDSEDEISPPPMSPHKNVGTGPDAMPRREEREEAPDLIIITHFNTFLTSLFTQREKAAAHTTLQLLATHMRFLTRNLPSQPVIILLNSTTSSASSSNGAAEGPGEDGARYQAAGLERPGQRTKAIDPTLRSLFNPVDLQIPGYVPIPAMRKNKPTYGLVFSQFLDLHLLCTSMPRSQRDADIGIASVTPGSGMTAAAGQEDAVIRYVTIVEVLLDEMGVWDGGMEGGMGRRRRRDREQRWGAVEVKGGRVQDAFFEEQGTYVPKEIRLSAGFGGRRV